MHPDEGSDPVDEAVQGGDLDELLRLVERLASARDWEQIERLRARCVRAHETGRQLWPAAEHAAYRLALEAPAPLVAGVLVEGMGRFTLGSLPEVAAQAHEWHDLAPLVAPGAPAVVTAHERVVRGEDCRDAEPPGPPVLDLPLVLSSWEPAYALAEYRSDTADFPAPDLPALSPVELPPAGSIEPPDDGVRALLDLVRVWTSGSDGQAHAVGVVGDAHAAIAALPATGRSVEATELDGEPAVALMAWAGASSGAHGRRPGAAAGRFAAWWALASLTDRLDPWPPEPERLGEALAELRWVLWRADAATTGWRLHLAVEHEASGRAWAVAAADSG